MPFEIGLSSIGEDKIATGDLRFGAYYDTSNVSTVESQVARFASASTVLPGILPAQFQRGRYGYWIQADHLIAGGAGPSARGTALYAAFNYGDPQTALLRAFLDAGIVQHGTFSGRDHDTISLGYAYGNINPNLRSFEVALDQAGYSVPVNTQEQIGELNYDVQMRPWLSLRPGVQYVWRPSGNIGIRNALVLDLSSTISFRGAAAPAHVRQHCRTDMICSVPVFLFDIGTAYAHQSGDPSTDTITGPAHTTLLQRTATWPPT
jgi:porin